MKHDRIFQVSLDSLTAHKLRTLLTMLGVIFGVGAVVAMLSIGEGAKTEALEQIEILGINNVIVNAVAPDLGRSSDQGLTRSPGLTLADGENIAEFTSMVENVIPLRLEPITTIYYGSNEAPARVVATLPDYVYSTSIEVEYGRFITDRDNDEYSQVCVLGAKAKRSLFAFENPIGQEVLIGELNFVVIGVMADKYIGRGKIEGFELKNLNEDVYIPLKTASKKMDRKPSSGSFRGWWNSGDEEEEKYNTPEIDQLTITVKDLAFVAAVTKLTENILNRRHYGVEDYEIVVPESLLRQTEKTQQIFNMVMGAIAGISLLVGGIGIMNIMLATVLERTREIGIRRAVGATRQDILRQFLIETVVICLIGCGVGIMVGIGIARGISFYADWPTIVSPYSIILAVGVSTAVGVIFGLYPANKASKLDVIDSLRYE